MKFTELREALGNDEPSHKEKPKMDKDGTVHNIPGKKAGSAYNCLLYTSPSPRDRTRSRMPSSA